MTRDTGTLLAQVIPVMALALGIELRSFATKIDADGREGKADSRERGKADYLAAYVGVFIAAFSRSCRERHRLRHDLEKALSR